MIDSPRHPDRTDPEDHAATPTENDFSNTHLEIAQLGV